MADSRTTKGLKIAGSVVGTMLILFSLIFIFVGIIFGIVSGVMSNTTKEQAETYLSAEAVITDIVLEVDCDGDTSTYPHIKYTVDGREYRTTLDFYSIDMFKGQTITILYDPENPSTVVYEKGAKTLVTIMGVVAAVFFAVGGIPLIIGIILIVISLKKQKTETSMTEEIKAADYSSSYRKDDKKDEDRYGGLGEGIE